MSKENIDKLRDEINLGYMAHLIQDKIWFDKYIGKYTNTNANDINKVEYLGYSRIKTDKEFTKDIYSDYMNLNKYLSNKYDLDI